MRYCQLTVCAVFLIVSCGEPARHELSSQEKALMFSGPVPQGGWQNPFYDNEDDIAKARLEGLKHALLYPIVDHAAVMPYDLADNAIELLAKYPYLRSIIKKSGLARFGTNWQEMFQELGLEDFPDKAPGDGAFIIPPLDEDVRARPMGVTVKKNKDDVNVFTYSCAACHVRNLFGRPVIGLNSLKSRAYEYVAYAKTLSSMLPKFLVHWNKHIPAPEKKQLLFTKEALRWVKAPKPRAMSLDTSIAAVAASLDLRAKDDFASRKKTPEAGRNIRAIMQGAFDSKPGTWWLFRYKNRFLTDGSVQGNPIVTNILWNEIGRGGKMRGLSEWFAANESTIAELTTAVMESQAPSWFDFFPDHFDLELAKAGESHFKRVCSGCHGHYEKNWHDQSSGDLKMLTRTIAVDYGHETIALDVGTDTHRSEGIRFLAAGLNNLKISQTHGAKTEYTGGYVPQPLIGIWARWPYFHNNSAATLCEVLTPSEQRRERFYVVPADDPDRDFDPQCVGLPHPDSLPKELKKKKFLFDTKIKGLSNHGHDQGIFIEDGRALLSAEEKRAIVEFLKTL